MAKKENKTNAMRILETLQIPFEAHTYECDEFIDGIQIADMLGLPHDKVFKTLVTQGASKNYFVFVIPIAEELDMKAAARSVGEKAVELIPVKAITPLTGYIRGGCTPLGMKKAFPTVIHSSALDFEEIIISGGRIGAQILLHPRDLVRVTGARVAPIIRTNEEEPL